MPARLILALLVAPIPLLTPLAALAQDRSRAAQPFAEIVEDPATLLRLAERALELRRTAEAADLLERAEARLLTRSELASEADRPAAGGAIGELAAAREAIARRDPAGAASLVAAARQRLESPAAPPDATTDGPPKAPLPGAPPPLPAAKPPPLR
jgi:hypothetical protein